MKDKVTITIGTPHNRDFTPEYVMSLALTLADLRYSYDVIFRESSVIHYNRNVIAQLFIGDYLLFIDSDMAWVPGDIQKLVEADKDIAVGLCFNRTAPPSPVVLPLSGKINSYEDLPKTPFEAWSSGCGFMLIKRVVLETFFSKKIWPFDPLLLSTLEESLSAGYGNSLEFPSDLYFEDHSFCYKARVLGFEIWCVPSASIGHIGTTVFMEVPPMEQWLSATETMRGYKRKLTCDA